MTDPSFDELASAHLDGVTTPTEAARIAADPALQARVEEFRRVRAALAEVPAADPAHREAAIAAALAAFDDDASAGPRAPVSPLAAVSTRRGPSPTAVRVLGAAAAIALLALLVPVLSRLAQSNDDQTASFDSTGEAIERAPEDARSGAEDSAVTTTTASSDDDADLGTFEDLTALVAAVSGDEPHASFGTDSTLGASADEELACPPSTASESSGDTSTTRAIESATATVAGDAVIVVVRTESAGTRTLLVYLAEDCALLAERPL